MEPPRRASLQRSLLLKRRVCVPGVAITARMFACSCPAAGSVSHVHHAQQPAKRPGTHSNKGGSSSSDGSADSSRAGSGDGAADDGLHVAVVWQDKTPTRIPEALWFSFRPAGGAVDPHSWRLHKLSSSIHPSEVRSQGKEGGSKPLFAVMFRCYSFPFLPPLPWNWLSLPRPCNHLDNCCRSWQNEWLLLLSLLLVLLV